MVTKNNFMLLVCMFSHLTSLHIARYRPNQASLEIKRQILKKNLLLPFKMAFEDSIH